MKKISRKALLQNPEWIYSRFAEEDSGEPITVTENKSLEEKDFAEDLRSIDPWETVTYIPERGEVVIGNSSKAETRNALPITMNTCSGRPNRGVDYAESQKPDGSIVSPKMIIGNDDRYQVTNVNAYPNRATAYLEITYANGVIRGGSGAFVGETTILTAAHLIYDPNFKWASSIKVYPGGKNSNYGFSYGKLFRANGGWLNNPSGSFYDYGIVEIENSMQTGWFGYRPLSNQELKNAQVDHYGYPTDKIIGTLWKTRSSIVGAYPQYLLTRIDCKGGQSGGPIVKTNEGDIIIAIHSAEYTSNSSIATRLTDEVGVYITENKNKHLTP